MNDVLTVESPAMDAEPLSEESLRQCLARGAEAVKREQLPDGSWDDDTDLGPTATAMHWIAEAALGGASPTEGAEAASYLLSQQRADGSFLPFPEATEGTATATALCRAGLLACGLSPTHPALVQAQDYVNRLGGDRAVADALRAKGDLTPLFLVAAGALEGSALPPLPPELALTPFDRLIDRKVHAGNVVIALVLCALVAKFARPAPTSFLAKAARKAENQRIQHTLFQWQNDAGDWNGQCNYTWLILVGLAATGLDRSDPRVARTLSWLRGKRRVTPTGVAYNSMGTDVWSTSFAALALHAAGEPFEGPVMSAARRHLLSAQCKRDMPRVNQRKPGAVRSGGWGFQRGNETMPDCDDTGVVLAPLCEVSGGNATREIFTATEAGAAWLRDMQNPDGGFASYVWNLPSKKPGPMYLVDVPLTLEDPGRVLSFCSIRQRSSAIRAWRE